MRRHAPAASLLRAAGRLRPLPAGIVVVATVVLAVGLRAEPAPDGVSTGRPGGTAATAPDRPDPLPVLHPCADAAPPCSVSSGPPEAAASAGADGVIGPILREDEFRLRGYDVDGAVLWSVSLTGDAATSPGPAGGVVVAEPGGRVRLLDGRTGVQRWVTTLPFADDWVLTAAGDEDTIAIAAAPPSPDGAPRVIRVVGLAPSDGEVAWVHLANTRAPTLTAEATGDVILLTGVLGDGVVSALDTTTGLLLWQAEVGAPLRVLAAAGRVLAASEDRLAILDAATGRRALDVRVPGAITGLLSVSATGAIVSTPDGPLTVALPDPVDPSG